MKTRLFTALALLLVSISFNTVNAETRAKVETTSKLNMLTPPESEYVSGRVICMQNGHVCVGTMDGVLFRAVNGNGMIQSGRIQEGEVVTARIIRHNGPGGMGEVTIIII